MSYLDTNPLQHNTVFSIYADREEILVNPDYQRNGDIWNLEKMQLLIDSILNRYDIPKLYFHKFDQKKVKETGKVYAIIDGRQRLETIWKFINGEFPLSDDFIYLKDSSISAKGMTYEDLGKAYPKIKNRFDSTTLPIIIVDTDDLDLIEDMFSRLNEAVPLNAAEKRNAFGGDMVKAINNVSKLPFFQTNLKFTDNRYRYKEVAARLLFIDYNLNAAKRIVDTKKVYLDKFVKDFKKGKKKEVDATVERITKILNEMHNVFTHKDQLLSAQAIIPIYYMLFEKLLSTDKIKSISRDKLAKFNKARESNRKIAERDLTEANFELIEFDRMMQQGTNDASSIKERFNIIKQHLGFKDL